MPMKIADDEFNITIFLEYYSAKPPNNHRNTYEFNTFIKRNISETDKKTDGGKIQNIFTKNINTKT